MDDFYHHDNNRNNLIKLNDYRKKRFLFWSRNQSGNNRRDNRYRRMGLHLGGSIFTILRAFRSASIWLKNQKKSKFLLAL